MFYYRGLSQEFRRVEGKIIFPAHIGMFLPWDLVLAIPLPGMLSLDTLKAPSTPSVTFLVRSTLPNLFKIGIHSHPIPPSPRHTFLLNTRYHQAHCKLNLFIFLTFYLPPFKVIGFCDFYSLLDSVQLRTVPGI